MSGKLYTFFIKQQFRPSFWGLFINPHFFARRALYKNIKKYSERISGKILDIGCGSKPYRELFKTVEYIGLDIEISGHYSENSQVDVLYNGTKMPFENNYFDCIVCFEVLEHVFNPVTFLREAHRVTKQGGLALFTVPFIWDEHEQPFDFARYSFFGLKYLFEDAGFRIVECKKYLCDPSILFLLANNYIYKTFKRIIPSRVGYLLILPLTFIGNILGSIFSLLPGNQDLYFGNILLVEKVENRG